MTNVGWIKENMKYLRKVRKINQNNKNPSLGKTKKTLLSAHMVDLSPYIQAHVWLTTPIYWMHQRYLFYCWNYYWGKSIFHGWLELCPFKLDRNIGVLSWPTFHRFVYIYVLLAAYARSWTCGCLKMRMVGLGAKVSWTGTMRCCVWASLHYSAYWRATSRTSTWRCLQNWPNLSMPASWRTWGVPTSLNWWKVGQLMPASLGMF